MGGQFARVVRLQDKMVTSTPAAFLLGFMLSSSMPWQVRWAGAVVLSVQLATSHRVMPAVHLAPCDHPATWTLALVSAAPCSSVRCWTAYCTACG